MKGYISEIFSSFQGEGGSVLGSCQGKRQIFIRFAGCNLAEAGRPCVWCDSPQAQDMDCEEAVVEKTPGSKMLESIPNPLDVDQVLEVVKPLKTPDLHSLSFTGGEPLQQIGFLESLCIETVERIYLETNGTLPKAAKRISGHVDFACVDLKDETALPYQGWRDTVEKELESIGNFKDAGVLVFAKVVATNDTKPETIAGIARELSRLDVPLAIQPVTTSNETERISQERLFNLTQAAAQYLSADDITISFQMHRLIGIL
jgi:organic radical activating enzyme